MMISYYIYNSTITSDRNNKHNSKITGPSKAYIYLQVKGAVMPQKNLLKNLLMSRFNIKDVTLKPPSTQFKPTIFRFSVS